MIFLRGYDKIFNKSLRRLNILITKCCICGNEVETKKILPFRDLIGADTEIYKMHIALCDHCDFIFQQNPLIDEQLENRYKNQSKYEYDANVSMFSVNYDKACRHQKYFIDGNLLTQGGGGYESVLEVGAASGYNLSLYKDKRCLGIEPSALNCKLAQKNYGVNMFNGLWAEFLASKPKETYDLIFTSGTLEHIVNPMKFIEECARLCNRYMFHHVPCFDIKFMDEPFGMFSDEHVNFFTIQSLWTLMNKAGFKLIALEMDFGLKDYMPAGSPGMLTLWEKGIESRTIYRSGDCLERYLRENEILLQEIDKKISAISSDEKLAVWGAGNQLHKLLGNTCLADKNIVRIYDSDKHKHGFKVMNIPVTPFNINDVNSGEVNAILITTCFAQKSILKSIAEMNVPCKIFTLYDI